MLSDTKVEESGEYVPAVRSMRQLQLRFNYKDVELVLGRVRVSGLTITLAQGAASLDGQLVLKKGETPPEGAFVYLIPAEREKGLDVLRFFAAAVSADGKIAFSNIAPGRYWVLVKSGEVVSSVTKLRSPEQPEFRAKLRREAEAANTTVEFKPCQNVSGFQIGWRCH